MKRKLDFGSGLSPAPGYLTCDVTGSPILDYVYKGGRITPAGDQEFSLIRCRNVVHHVPDLKEMFDEFWRVLDPGGMVFVEDCPPEHFTENVCLDTLWYRVVVPRPEIWFSKGYRDYTRVALRCGFRIAHCSKKGVKEKRIFQKIEKGRGRQMAEILAQLQEAGYDYAIAIATQAEIEAGAACGQLSIISE